MPLDIHPNYKKRLKEKTAGLLSHVTFENMSYFSGYSAQLFSLLDDILPTKGDIRDQLDSQVGEHPLYEFISSEMLKDLRYNYEYESDSTPIKAEEIDHFSDLEEYSNYLIEHFDSLPFKYSFMFELPQNLFTHFTENQYKFGEKLRLIQPDNNMMSDFDLSSGNERIDRRIWSLFRGIGGLMIGSGIQDEELDRGKYYLQYFETGYSDNYATTETASKVINHIKSFFGLCIAQHVHKYKYQYINDHKKYKKIIHIYQIDRWLINNALQIDDEMCKALRCFETEDFNKPNHSDEQKRINVNAYLKNIDAVFNNEEKCEKILLASQWFFDSYGGTNELLSFIQTTIAIEILLGEKNVSDLMGLSELLRNRCAYLIGNNRKERDKLLHDFKEIYDIRSKIVHRGKSKLTYHERSLFRRLQWICTRVIQEEVKLVINEKSDE